MDVWYTLAHVADELNLSRATVARHIQYGWLKATKNPGRNGALRISRKWLDEYINERMVVGATSVDITAAAAALGCTPRTVQRYIQAGELATIAAPGRAWRVRRESLDDLIARRRTPMVPPAPRAYREPAVA